MRAPTERDEVLRVRAHRTHNALSTELPKMNSKKKSETVNV